MLTLENIGKKSIKKKLCMVIAFDKIRKEKLLYRIPITIL